MSKRKDEESAMGGGRGGGRGRCGGERGREMVVGLC